MAPTIVDQLKAALAHHQAGRTAEARTLYDAVLTQAPDTVDALHLLGVLARQEGDLPTALRLISRALAINPRFAAAYSNLGNALQDSCRLTEAMNAHRTALTLDPRDGGAHRRLLNCLLYVPGVAPEPRFAAHLDYAARHQPPIEAALPPPANDRDPDRPLRIGLLSSDLRNHPVGHLLRPWFRWCDRTTHQLICYAEVAAPDRQSELFRAAADGWRSTVGLADRAVAEMIRNDRIDLLIVLAARFDRNRPMVACYRPAPVQVSMFDGATTGLRGIDHWITDPVLTPPDSTERFTEQLVPLPRLMHYPPLESAPAVTALPASTGGAVTFGSFSNPIKISPPTIALWSRVLRAMPGSRLLLKYHTRFADPALELRFRIAFGSHDVAPAQLLFRAADDDQSTHLSAYADIDIALDTAPFNGSTTTFEALWMGVPVITLAGDTMISRLSAGLLTAAGLTELIAPSPDAFVACATGLARDLDRLAALRAGLRARLTRSPLCDGPAYVRSLENLWRTLWRAWCVSPG